MMVLVGQAKAIADVCANEAATTARVFDGLTQAPDEHVRWIHVVKYHAMETSFRAREVADHLHRVANRLTPPT